MIHISGFIYVLDCATQYTLEFGLEWLQNSDWFATKNINSVKFTREKIFTENENYNKREKKKFLKA